MTAFFRSTLFLLLAILIARSPNLAEVNVEKATKFAEEPELTVIR